MADTPVPQGPTVRYRYKNKNKPRDGRPQKSKWAQQRLTAYRPVCNATTVMPAFLILGILFIGLGILFYLTAENAKELVIDYTECRTPNGSLANSFVFDPSNNTCVYTIQLETDFNGTVKFFYGLDGFYMNNRLYIKSRNDEQLVGKLDKVEDCGPFDYVRFENGTKSNIPYAPCGKMADSMFNDTFQLFYSTPQGQMEVPVTTVGMLHNLEQERKFKNPHVPANKTLCDVFEGTMRPPNWTMNVCEFGANDTKKGFESIDFQVWMKPAALPKFRKVYRILDRQADYFKHGMPKGEYMLHITYNYPVDNMKINKSFIIALNTWIGSKNYFLGISYLCVGGLLVLLSAIFLGIHVVVRGKTE